jgi:hypothetical protein
LGPHPNRPEGALELELAALREPDVVGDPHQPHVSEPAENPDPASREERAGGDGTSRTAETMMAGTPTTVNKTTTTSHTYGNGPAMQQRSGPAISFGLLGLRDGFGLLQRPLEQVNRKASSARGARIAVRPPTS